MFCKKCGARINDEDNVCPKCGVSLDTQLSNESTKNLEDEFEELLKPDVQTTTNEDIIWQEAPEVGTINLPTDSSSEVNNSQEKVANNIIPSMSSEKTVKDVVETESAPQSAEEKTTQTKIKETVESKDDVSVTSKESESAEEEVTAEIEEPVEEIETETISTEVVEDDIVVDDMIMDDFILDDSSEVVFEDLNAESTEEIEIQDEVIEPVVEDVPESDDVGVIEPEIEEEVEEEIIEEEVSEPVVEDVPESDLGEEVVEPDGDVPESDLGEDVVEPDVDVSESDIVEPKTEDLTPETSVENESELLVTEEIESESSVSDNVEEDVIQPESEPKVIGSMSQSENEYTFTVDDEDDDEDIKSKFNKKLTSDDELDEFDYDLDENVNNLTSKFTTVIIIILILVIAVIIATLLFQNLGL